MCLEIPKKVTLEKEKRVYKVFYKNYWDEEMMKTPFCDEEVMVGETMTVDAEGPIYRDDYWSRPSIAGNAIHSYLNPRDAFSLATILAWRKRKAPADVLVCECTIPTDSKYTYVGNSNIYGGEVGYASQKLKINKVVACMWVTGDIDDGELKMVFYDKEIEKAYENKWRSV